MTILVAPTGNELQNVLASSYTRGTDTTVVLTDATVFPNSAHVIRIRNLDNTKWCLIIYTSKATNTLTMGGGATDYALAKNVTVGDEAYEWPIGSIVELLCAADEIAQLFTVDAAAGTGSLRTLGTTSQKACAGDDSRLSDARTPTAHKDSHDPEDGSDKVDTGAAAEVSAVVAAGAGTSHSLARADHVHAINHAITDNHLVTIDGTTNQPVATDYAKFTANGLEGMAKTQILSDLNVADGADVTGSNAPQTHKDSHDPEDGGDALDTAAALEIASVQAAGTGSSHSLARADHVHAIAHGVADNHIVTIDHATPVATDYARFTANGLEGRESSEVKTDLGYMTDLLDDTTPQLGGDADLNGHYIKLKNEPTANDTGSGTIISATVDANATGIAAALHLAADGHYEEADASAGTTAPCTALALEAGTGTKNVLLTGIMRHDAWNWTTGPGEAGLIYLSATTGALTQTIPTAVGDIIQVVGYAVTDDTIYFYPELAHKVQLVEYRILDKDTSHTVDTGVGGDLRVPIAMTVLAVGAYCDTAGTTSVTTIDINEAGTTILSTKITIDATEKTSETAATPPVISDSAIAADAILTFDIDGIASGTAGKGLTVWLKVTF